MTSKQFYLQMTLILFLIVIHGKLNVKMNKELETLNKWLCANKLTLNMKTSNYSFQC